jgi:hypothetical protein
MHYIKTSVLRTLVLNVIKRVSGFVRVNGEEFTRLVREASEIQSAEAARARKALLGKSKKRYAELDSIIKRLYEDKVAGSLSSKRFELLSGEYEDEQEKLERQITELEAELGRFSEDSEKADKFIKIVHKYTDFSELTPAMLNEFVEKVLVHEAERVNGRRAQKVEIYLNFIGKFEVPGYEEAEPEPFDPVEHQREIWRNFYHRHKEEIRVEKAKRAEAKKAAKLAEKAAVRAARSPEEIEAEVKAKWQRKREYHREWRRRRKQEAGETART